MDISDVENLLEDAHRADKTLSDWAYALRDDEFALLEMAAAGMLE